ncbi:MAG: hypothetical protein NDI75_15505, partial [Candidatus Didemnitutus sp.]|nr:hypothetical protein [Candidatus Didemnitutus sp.]
DSGAPGETRCEAVTYWSNPARFARRVCPLLAQNAAGEWRCHARVEQVRPFWWPVARSYAIAATSAVALAGGSVWLTMRVVGYDVSPRQLLWPPAWSELRGVRAEFFRRESGVYLEQGRFREALAALDLASELEPNDYATGMLLARVDQFARPDHVDRVYRRLFDLHPDRREQTAQVWFRSMLARAQLAGVIELAQRRLGDAPAEWTVWLHGLLFAARLDKNWEALEKVARQERLPAEARAVIELELQLRRTEWTEARKNLLRAPLPTSPYAWMNRVELLLEWGEGMEALQLLRENRDKFAQRDYARLTLAAHAVARNRVALDRDVRELLGRADEELAAAVAIVGQHLVQYPNRVLLDACRDATARLPGEITPGREEALAAVYCALALDGRVEELMAVQERMGPSDRIVPTSQQRVESAFRQPGTSPLMLLLVVRPMSLELNYAILTRAAERR